MGHHGRLEPRRPLSGRLVTFPANAHARKRAVRAALRQPRKHSVMSVYVHRMGWVEIKPNNGRTKP